MAHPVTWFQISGRDGSALQSFYRDVFNWRMNPSPDGTMMMVDAEQPDGIPGGVGVSPDGASSVAIYINVDDIDAHLERIAQAGGKHVMPKMELPGNMGFIAGFIDPAGNWMGIWQPPAQPMDGASIAKDAAERVAKKAAERMTQKAAAKAAIKGAQKAAGRAAIKAAMAGKLPKKAAKKAAPKKAAPKKAAPKAKKAAAKAKKSAPKAKARKK